MECMVLECSSDAVEGGVFCHLHAHMTAEVDKIDTQLNFEIGKEMLYLFDGFNSLPHGDFKVNDLPEAMKKLEDAKVSVKTIRVKDKFCFDYNQVKIFYNGSTTFQSLLSHLKITRIQWADHVISNGDAAKGRRKNNISQSFSKGIQVLYTNNSNRDTRLKPKKVKNIWHLTGLL